MSVQIIMTKVTMSECAESIGVKTIETARVSDGLCRWEEVEDDVRANVREVVCSGNSCL